MGWWIVAALVAGSLLASTLAAQPPVPGDWTPIPELTDEFDGEHLDTAKWWDTNPQWKGRQPALFRASNVAVSDGMLHLTMRREEVPDAPEGYHTFTSAAVKSKAKVLYGYFEIRSRAMDSHGSSAFWFYDSTPEIWTEIDVFEMSAAPKHEQTVYLNVHVFHTPTVKEHFARPKRYDAPWKVADDYHLYALLWTPEELVFYVDGEERYRLENTHWHQPLYLNFDSETMPDWFGLPTEEDTLPSTFSVDYVRSWRMK
jgi:beta-glucanase (GH16 family)